MTKLNFLDSEFSNLLLQLTEEIRNYELLPQFEFELANNFDLSQLEKLKYPGVYLFEIYTGGFSDSVEGWMTPFLEKWQDSKYRAHFVPNSRKSRITAHTELKDWLPIYVGKSKDISKRIKEHLYLEMSRPTGALKLLARENIYGQRFRISTIHINVKNYDLIMPLIERSVRNKVNPILGRQ